MARERYDVSGKVVFITGAARGIGADAAARLHARGASIALAGLEPEELERRAAELGERAAVFECDVTDDEALRRAVEDTVERFGGIDVAIANAGLAFIGSLADQPPEQFERTLDVNLTGVYRTNHAVLPHVIARRGYVLNVASLSAISHSPLMAAYTASKAGVEAMTDALRIELAPTGARAGCVYFGFVDTDLVRRSFAHEATRSMNSSLPRPLAKPLPLAAAGKTIERAVERRVARAYAPRWTAGMQLVRGMLQPLVDRQLARDPRLAEALEHARAAHGPAADLELGIAAAPDGGRDRSGSSAAA